MIELHLGGRHRSFAQGAGSGEETHFVIAHIDPAVRRLRIHTFDVKAQRFISRTTETHNVGTRISILLEIKIPHRAIVKCHARTGIHGIDNHTVSGEQFRLYAFHHTMGETLKSHTINFLCICRTCEQKEGDTEDGSKESNVGW